MRPRKSLANRAGMSTQRPGKERSRQTRPSSGGRLGLGPQVEPPEPRLFQGDDDVLQHPVAGVVLLLRVEIDGATAVRDLGDQTPAPRPHNRRPSSWTVRRAREGFSGRGRAEARRRRPGEWWHCPRPRRPVCATGRRRKRWPGAGDGCRADGARETPSRRCLRRALPESLPAFSRRSDGTPPASRDPHCGGPLPRVRGEIVAGSPCAHGTAARGDGHSAPRAALRVRAGDRFGRGNRRLAPKGALPCRGTSHPLQRGDHLRAEEKN